MLRSHANQTVSAFMASLDGDGVVYCNSSSLNFLLKKDVYQPLFTDKKYHPGLRRFSIPGVRVTYNDRIAAKAVVTERMARLYTTTYEETIYKPKQTRLFYLGLSIHSGNAY